MAVTTLSPELAAQIAVLFRALSDESRLRLMLRLREGEANVSTLMQATELSQASTSKHLNTLRQAGLVAVRREGTQAIYRVRDESVFQICQLVCDCVKRRHAQDHAALAADLDDNI